MRFWRTETKSKTIARHCRAPQHQGCKMSFVSPLTRVVWSAAVGAAVLFAVPSAAQQDPNQPNPPGADGAEELTRGPIHEAFAGPVVFNPKPGVVAPKAVPEVIEELPPDQKPEGDVVWIPGYWSWDDERTDFIWISGIWRDPPPGMTWVPGYWSEVENGYQWTSGHWQQVDQEEVEFLPEPPQSLEQGPNIPQPDDNHFWVPGTYVWRDSRYFWQGGYWTGHQPGWVWSPARYHWTPTGYIYTAGFWDGTMETRGMMFAPVYFRGPRPRNYYYSPGLVLNVGAVTAHLFCRPYQPYYMFGDYYDTRYVNAGFTPWFQFSSTRYGYDPNFNYYRTHFHRTNPRWAVTLRSNYDLVRRDVNYRPPRTFVQQNNIVQNITNVNTTVQNTMVNNVTVNNISNNTVGRIGSVNMATRLDRAVQQNSFTNLKVAKIDERDRRQIQNVSLKTRELGNQRRTLEQNQLQQLRASSGAPKGGGRPTPVALKQPVKVKLDQQTVSNLNAGASKVKIPGSAGAGAGAKGGGQANTGAGVRPGANVGAGKTGDAAVGTPGMKPGGTGTPGGKPGVTTTVPGAKPGGAATLPGTKPGGATMPKPGVGTTVPGSGKGPPIKVDPKTPPGPGTGTKPPVVNPKPLPGSGATGGTKTPPTGSGSKMIPGSGSAGKPVPGAGSGKPVPGAGSGGQPPIKRPPPPQTPAKEKEKEKQKGRVASNEGVTNPNAAAMRSDLIGRRGSAPNNDAGKQAQIAAQQKAAQQQAAQQKAAQQQAQMAAQQKSAQQQAAQQKAAQQAAQQKAAQQQAAQQKAAQQQAQMAAQQKAAQQQAAQQKAAQQQAQKAAQQQAAQKAAQDRAAAQKAAQDRAAAEAKKKQEEEAKKKPPRR